MQVINQRQEQSFERRNSLVSVNVCTRAGSCQVCYPTSTKRKIIIFALNKLERERGIVMPRMVMERIWKEVRRQAYIEVLATEFMSKGDIWEEGD